MDAYIPRTMIIAWIHQSAYCIAMVVDFIRNEVPHGGQTETPK